MSSTLKKLLIGLGIVVVSSGVYFLYSSQSDTEVVAYAPVSGDVKIKTEKILNDIQRVDGYITSVEVFEDPRFTSLIDYSVSIPDVETGRPNPFQPI